MKRMGMISGVRKSAKQAVLKFVDAAIMKIDVCGIVDARVKDQLLIYKAIAREMNWSDVESKINKAIEQGRSKGIFTEP